MQLTQMSLIFKNPYCNLIIRDVSKIPCETFFCYALLLIYLLFNKIVPHFSCEKTLLNITHDRIPTFKKYFILNQGIAKVQTGQTFDSFFGEEKV